MGMMQVAIMGFIVLILLIAVVMPIMMMLSGVRSLLGNDLLFGVLSLIGVVVVLSFFWYGAEVLRG